ncbi:MAG: hypothetical protein ACRDTD_15105 [Pseudonocardiaceae bacterium]
MGDDGPDPDALSVVRWRQRYPAVGRAAAHHVTGLTSRHPVVAVTGDPGVYQPCRKAPDLSDRARADRV